MRVAESRSGRRLVARLDRGVELVRAVIDLCNGRGVRAGELRGLGALEELEVREYDQRQRAWGAPRKFATPSTIVQLYGNLMELDGKLHLEASCAVARSTDNGVEVVGGALVRARVHAVEIVVEAFDDLLLRRTAEGPTSLALWSEAHEAQHDAGGGAAATANATVAAGATANPPNIDPNRAPAPGEARWDLKAVRDEVEGETARDTTAAAVEPPASQTASSSAWGQVIAVSAALPAVEEPVREAALHAGDIVEHPRFGRCEVERIEGDAEFAQVRLRNGRLVRLSLDVLTFEKAGVDGGKRLFRAVPPRGQ